MTGLSLSNNSTLSTGKKKCTVRPDESVIILSDNEENSVEKETDVELLSLGTVVEGDLSRENSEPARVRRVRRKLKSRVKTKTITSQVTSPEKESSVLGLCSDSNTTEPQSISIDSEDENTSELEIVCFCFRLAEVVIIEPICCRFLTGPNEDSSRSHSQAEIIIIDNSLIETDTDVSMSTIPSSFSPGKIFPNFRLLLELMQR